MTVFEAIVLGIVQGLTEFLPVSSSGHIELGKILLQTNLGQDSLLFSVVVHAATALSTMVVFGKDIWQLLRGMFQFRWNEETQFAAKILLSMVPAGLVGLTFKTELEALFDGNLLLVGCSLLFTGLVLWLTTVLKPRVATEVSFGQALAIGLAQAVAILPGVSRSGSTIATALMVGVDRSKAARFSFLMALPVIFGATLLELKDYLEAPAGHATGLTALPLALGFAAAFVTGLAACRLMIGLVRRGKLVYFAIYCLLVGAAAVSWAFTQR
jgi:undecaprenyl-diphosphatase